MHRGSSQFKEERIRITLRISKDMKEKILSEATKKEIPFNSEVIHLLQIGLDTLEKEQKTVDS